MLRKAVLSILILSSPAQAADDVLVRHLDTVLNFVAISSATCVQRYEDGLSATARAKLNFSEGEIAAYCACSTKRLIREMGSDDFQSLAAGNDLPAKFAPKLKQAHFDCAKTVWEARQRGK